MKVKTTALPGVLVIEPQVHRDARGAFSEIWNSSRYRELAPTMPPVFVQDNVSVSHRGVVRGLHFQCPREQAKLVCVVRGAVFDVGVDIRRGSPTFGRFVSETVSAENQRQIFWPAGYAHGFLALE